MRANLRTEENMKAHILSLLLLIFTFSCVKKEEKIKCVGAPESTIEGVWQAQCVSGSSSSYRATVTVLCSTMSQQIDFFSAVGCLEADKTRILTNAGGYFTTLGASSAVAGATEFDIYSGSSELAPVTDAEASSMNTSSYCGITNWAASIKQGVSGTCGLDYYGSPGIPSYSLYQVVNLSLYFGIPSGSYDGVTAQNRYNTLGSLGYIKTQ